MMRKYSAWWGLCLVPALAGAEIIASTPVELNLATGIEPVCYYADQRYSRGARIKVGEHWFVCERETSFEQNGRLSWHLLEPKAGKERN